MIPTHGIHDPSTERGEESQCEWDPQIQPERCLVQTVAALPSCQTDRPQYRLTSNFLPFPITHHARSKYALVDELEQLRERLQVLEQTLRSPARLDVCCPPSCSCHENTPSRTRSTPVAVPGDHPLSELIDQKLGFRRNVDVEPGLASTGDSGAVAACCGKIQGF